MGIATPKVDALTFALGSGIAGIAGVALSQIDNVSPNLGQGLHHRFLHGCRLRRRRQSVGHADRGAVARRRQQVPRALCRRGIRQNPCAGADRVVHPAPPARVVRIARPGGGAMILIRFLGRGLHSRAVRATTLLLILAAIAVPLLSLALPAGHPLAPSPYLVPLIGKYLCFAMLALALDLVWGYAGILSLGHGAFFALGGYAMGMYMMRQIGARGVYGNPLLPDFMVFLNWKDLPWYWLGFDRFWFAALMVVAVPGVLAFVFGWFAFKSRVTGVYLSIITQALTYALMLAFFRNETGFGGNNGLTDFKEILGHSVSAPATRAALFSASALALAGALVLVSAVVSSKYGKVLVAVRDAESRTRFLGYRPENIKLVAFVLSAMIAGVAGALYVPQVGIINPGEFDPANSIEIVIWTAVGGRGTLVGPIAGALLVNAGKSWFTGALPEYWLFALGGLFVAVTLFLPKGLAGLAAQSAPALRRLLSARKARPLPQPDPAE
ncbi:MAG: urea ABC transporter permease subunit UrtC [Phyllobacteriaceae bacterium]|nr:urea ABC transporter permease subunit UrtC [Phyllobacteriaceae bacterium]